MCPFGSPKVAMPSLGGKIPSARVQLTWLDSRSTRPDASFPSEVVLNFEHAPQKRAASVLPIRRNPHFQHLF